MVRLTELRIGDLLEAEHHQKGDKQIKKVSEIRQKYVLLDGTSYHLNELTPVLLTGDVLAKCGFMKFDWITESNVFAFNQLKCKLDDEGAQIFDDEFHNPKPVRWLHELQNLYFDLTGTELEVNLGQMERTAMVE